MTHPHQIFLKTTFSQWASLRQRRDTLGAEGGIDIVGEVTEEGRSIQSDSQQKHVQTAPLNVERPSIVRVLGRKGVIAKLPGTVTVIPKAEKRGKVKKEKEGVAVEQDTEKDTEAVYTHFQAHLPQLPETPPKTQNHLIPFQPPVQDDIVDLPWEITEEEPPVTNDSEPPRNPQELLDILDTTDSISHAWDAYQHLMALPREEGSRLPVPWTHLQRLTRLLVSTKPRTRTNFIRLLTVISTIHKHGGHVHLWQWNALIDFAGRGWRKTRPEDYNNAIGVFNDLLYKRDPGSTFSRSAMDEDPNRRIEGESLNDDDSGFDNWPAPNVVTLTTLLNIAGRTLYPPTFQHASDLFRNSGMPPNRITLLARLRYFSRRGELTGIRTTISQMRDHEFDLGIDGTNACLWAYAYNGRLDTAQAIYDILKSRVRILNGDDSGEDIDKNVVELEKFLEAKEGIAVPEGIGPDLITFRALLQCFAYHGDLMQSLSIFMDMIKFMQEGHGRRGGGAENANGKSSTAGKGSDGKLDVGRKEDRDGKRRKLKRKEDLAYQTTYMLPAYRAIFLGFVRHALSPKGLVAQKTLSHRLKHIHDGAYRDRAAWNLSALEALFDDFLRLPSGARPSERTLYWIMVAFSRCTGDDAEKLREVYQKLETRYGGGWGGRMAWLKKVLHGGT